MVPGRLWGGSCCLNANYNKITSFMLIYLLPYMASTSLGEQIIFSWGFEESWGGAMNSETSLLQSMVKCILHWVVHLI